MSVPNRTVDGVHSGGGGKEVLPADASAVGAGKFVMEGGDAAPLLMVDEGSRYATKVIGPASVTTGTAGRSSSALVPPGWQRGISFRSMATCMCWVGEAGSTQVRTDVRHLGQRPRLLRY